MKPSNFIPWLGFAPDMDPTAPGVIVDAYKLVPTERGMRTYYNPATTPHSGAAPAFITQLFTVEPNGNPRVIYACGVSLYSMQSDLVGVTVNVTPTVSPPTYSAQANWFMETFGNVVLAVYGQTAFSRSPIYWSHGTSVFQVVPTAPNASVIVAANGFVMALNVNDAAFSFVAPDGWWCSKRYDHTDWTLASGGSTRGRLVDSNGPITAGIEFDNAVYAFKPGNMYRGTFVGIPEMWQWDKLPFKMGCPYPHGICKDENRIYFMGADDLYAFDGATLRPLMVGKVKRWFWNRVNANTLANDKNLVLKYDARSNSIFILYPVGFQEFNVLTYHIPTERFGVGDNSYSAISEPSALSFIGQAPLYAARISDRKVYMLAGYDGTLGGTPSLRTGLLGDDLMYSEIKEVRVRSLVQDSVSNIGLFTREKVDLTAGNFIGSTGATTDGKFELRASARWHQLSMSLAHNHESIGISTDLTAKAAR